MKILILSASIGSGHTKAAEALQKIFGESAQVIDFMAKEISTLNWLTKKFYLAALRFIPDLYDRIYKFADGRRVGVSARFLSSALMYLPFARLLKNFNPDVVICTHPFPEAAASLWKFLHAKSARNFLLATVLTDYSLHEIWIYGEVDVYFVATEEMKRELAAHCRTGQKIFATGIPIDEKFSSEKKIVSKTPTILIMGGGLGLGSIEETLTELDKIQSPLKVIVVAGQNENLLARLKKLKISHEVEVLGYVADVDKLMAAADLLITKPETDSIKKIANAIPTILIMGGGLGLGSIEETLTELDKIQSPLKVIVVAGQNENLLTRLKKLKISHEVEVLGYVADVDRLMAAADLLITKPGALTMTEAFASGLPLILHAPIPGPEALNAAYAVNHGAAIEVGDKKISEVIEELLKTPARLDEMRRCAKKISRPFAAREIVNQIKKISSAM